MADYRSLDDATNAEWEALARLHRESIKAAAHPNKDYEPRLNVLAEAARVVSGDRQHSYGHPRDNHQATADLYNAYLRRRYGADAPTLDVRAVCMLNMLQKISRDANRPKRDNLVDIAGYARNIEMADEADE